MITFIIPAVPIAQPRQRHRIIPGTAFTSNYTPAKHPVNVFKASAQMAARLAYSGAPLEGPLIMDVEFVFPRPAHLPKRLGDARVPHDVKPDRDNLLKSLQDALNGLLYRDDAQICSGLTTKWRASTTEQPHVRVSIREVPVL